jgi:hypothetical protein
MMTSPKSPLRGLHARSLHTAEIADQASGYDPVVLLCRAHGLPEPTREVRFHPERLWRFDWGWENWLVALEQEGGLWVRGRHSRASGFEADCIKYAEAMLLGWVVFRASPKQIQDGTVLSWLQRALTPL